MGVERYKVLQASHLERLVPTSKLPSEIREAKFFGDLGQRLPSGNFPKYSLLERSEFSRVKHHAVPVPQLLYVLGGRFLPLSAELLSTPPSLSTNPLTRAANHLL